MRCQKCMPPTCIMVPRSISIYVYIYIYNIWVNYSDLTATST